MGRHGASALTLPIYLDIGDCNRRAAYPCPVRGPAPCDGGHESSCLEALRGRPNRVVATRDGPSSNLSLVHYLRGTAGPSRRGIAMPCSTRDRPYRLASIFPVSCSTAKEKTCHSELSLRHHGFTSCFCKKYIPRLCPVPIRRDGRTCPPSDRVATAFAAESLASPSAPWVSP